VTRAEIEDGIVAVARQHLGFAGDFDPRLRLVEDLGFDSLKLLTLAAEIENRFRVTLDPDEEATIATLGDLLAVLQAKLPDTKLSDTKLSDPELADSELSDSKLPG
jgi:acyl carrier protein